MKTILNINEKHEVKNYPYGRLRTSAFFSIEFDRKKGFRSVFQTINPKTGRLNAEKKSTYSRFAYLFIEEGTGHIKNGGYSINGNEAVNAVFTFLHEHKATLSLSNEMLESICLSALATIKVGAAYTHCSKEKLIEVINPAVTTLVAMLKEQKYDRLDKIQIDLEKIKQLEKEWIAVQSLQKTNV